MARRARGGPVWVGQAKYRSVKGVLALQKRIAAIPAGVAADVRPALIKSADALVDKIRPIVPVSELEAPKGPRLRDTVRREDGPHELSVVVIEDGEDAEGQPIAKHVEHGHRTVSGRHVPAYPHFWPAYRVLRKSIRRWVGSAMTRAAKKAFARPQGSEDA